MKRRIRIFRTAVFLIIFMTLSICLYCCENAEKIDQTEKVENTENKSEPKNSLYTQTKRKLACKNITQKEFNASIENPELYIINETVVGGVIPHHTAASPLISGFFKAVSENTDDYDTVIIIAPNHQGDIGDVVLSFCDWDIGYGVYCDIDIENDIYQKKSDNYSMAEDDNRVENDHSASVIIPYVNYYLPKAKAAVFLVSRTMTLENIFNFAKTLSNTIKESNKKILLVCSVDFSHYLPPYLARENDKITKQAIQDRNYAKIYNFTNEYLDSPATLITFLVYLSESGIADGEEKFLINTDASEFLGGGISETTTYFVIAAYDAAI